jgi:hypothetical protein
MRLAMLLGFVCSCASVPLRGEGGAPAVVVVTGHVVQSCPAVAPLQQEPVTIRAAGELEQLSATRTDGEGAFQFELSQAEADLGSFLIEARGVRTVAKAQLQKQAFIAELSLPCSTATP